MSTDKRIRSDARAAEIAEVMKECQAAMTKVRRLNFLEAISLTVEETHTLVSAIRIVEQQGTIHDQVAKGNARRNNDVE